MRTWMIAGVCAGTMAMLLGCGTKAADCDSFAKVANANVGELKKSDAKDAKALAASVKKVADSARSVAVKDEGLAPLVKEYSAAWDTGATAAGNLESTDEAVQKKALADIEALEKNESTIVDKINAYCK